jgi:hypothetical protein
MEVVPTRLTARALEVLRLIVEVDAMEVFRVISVTATVAVIQVHNVIIHVRLLRGRLADLRATH